MTLEIPQRYLSPVLGPALGFALIVFAAVAASCSSSGPREVFKRETGYGFLEYLNTLRMEKAKLLLEQPLLKVSEIAESIGISNANYFSRLFKAYTGLGPEEYRKTSE